MSLAASNEKGGKKPKNGDGSPPPGEAAQFSVRDLGLFTDSTGFPYGDGSVECDAEASIVTADAEPIEARLALPAPPRKAHQEDPDCRRLWLELDLRHDGFDASGAHIDTPVPATFLRVSDVAIHVDDQNRPTGTASLATESDFCAGARRRGRTVGPAAFRFSPSGANAIAGSTTLSVEARGSNGWRVRSNPGTIAGCIESASNTTFWHIDIDLDVELDSSSPPPPEPPAPAPPAGDATIVVNSGELHQRILGWEATAQAGQFEIPSFPAFQTEVLDRVVNELGINRVRLEVRSGAENTQDYFELWRSGAISRDAYREQWYRPINDNGSASVTNENGFQFGRLDASVDLIVEPMRQRIEANGESLYVSLCFVDFHSSPGITALNPDEYAEFMLVTFRHLQAKYGWVPDAIEIILEPELSTWSGERIGHAIAATHARLLQAGFTPDFVAPSTTNMTAAVEYFDEMIGIPGVADALTEISYHRYAGVSGGSLDAIAARAQSFGLGTAMLEHIGSGYEAMHEDLKRGRNTSWSQYTIAWDDGSDDGGKYYLVDDANNVELARQARLLRQYMAYVRGGAQRVGASSADSSLDPLAFINPTGQHVVIVKADGAAEFTVQGLPAGTYGINYATSSVYNVELTEVTIGEGGLVTAQIPGRGVMTIYLKRAT